MHTIIPVVLVHTFVPPKFYLQKQIDYRRLILFLIKKIALAQTSKLQNFVLNLYTAVLFPSCPTAQNHFTTTTDCFARQIIVRNEHTSPLRLVANDYYLIMSTARILCNYSNIISVAARSGYIMLKIVCFINMRDKTVVKSQKNYYL